MTNSGEDARREADSYKSELEDQLASTLGQRSYDQLVRLLTRACPLIAEMAAGRRSANP